MATPGDGAAAQRGMDRELQAGRAYLAARATKAASNLRSVLSVDYGGT